MSSTGTPPSPPPRLDKALLSHILSFCEATQLLDLLDVSPSFETAVRWTLCSSKALHLSCLVTKFSNRIQSKHVRNDQEDATTRLLRFLSNMPSNQVRHLELSNLRWLTGFRWVNSLEACSSLSLTSLNLSGCANLEPRMLINLIQDTCLDNLKHLNLQQCSRVGIEVVSTISVNLRHLHSLLLGGCSPAIDTATVRVILSNLRCLKHLDFSGLKHITDHDHVFLRRLPDTLQSLELASCEGLQLGGLDAHNLALVVNQPTLQRANPPPAASTETSRLKLTKIDFNSIGTPRRGLAPGALSYFAMGKCLRQVSLNGCEQVDDREISVLAVHCSTTLESLELRACQIGNRALIALATHCDSLVELDVSACFRVNDIGILALCNSRGRQGVAIPAGDERQKRQRGGSGSILKVLKLANLATLSDPSILAMASLEHLLVLDVKDCPNITSAALFQTIPRLRNLIDLDARGIRDSTPSLPTLLRRQVDQIPKTLRFVNHKLLFPPKKDHPPINAGNTRCCSVSIHSQRLTRSESVPLQAWMHCVDCELIPAYNRGICTACVSTCHNGHNTFLGSWTRFYCDCPFSGSFECQALSRPNDGPDREGSFLRIERG
jgi:hypothetical protein